MTEVRKHVRTTAKGKQVTVRHHTRDTGDGARAGYARRPEEARGWSVSSLPPASARDGAEDWWADDEPDPARMNFELMAEEMRAWRARPEPAASPAEPMTPQLVGLLGCDTPEGLAKYERGRAYREAGYDGPLDSDNQIPDPDDPANWESLSALAAMRK